MSTSDNYPPRPGDRDGTLFDRAVFWGGFALWLAFMILGWVLLGAARRLRRWWP